MKMPQMLDILERFLNEVEKDNPFNLVLKGGTALSLYYLNHHRESEDLDFDAEKNLINKSKAIESYLTGIFEKLKQEQVIGGHKVIKAGFASTSRYHIKIELKTHKTFYTKIDIDFVNLPKKLVSRGKLRLYTKERMFIAKAVTFADRKGFKDLYDIAYLLEKIDIAQFKKKPEIAGLVDKVIEALQQEDIKALYKTAFRNVDLRFKNLKEPQLEAFIDNTIRKLRVLANNLRK